MTTLDVVVGAQFGSEAKGHCTQRLAEAKLRQFGAVQVVRVAGPNAGHTGYDSMGRRWALRQLPVAVVTGSPGVVLGIAPGSEIDMPVLLDEIDQTTSAGILDPGRLWVSGEATLIKDRHKKQEGADDLVSKIGSTGKGIGAARAERLMRKTDRLIDDPEAVRLLGLRGVQVIETHQYSAGVPLIVEGTQGYGLGLHAGYYPQCTSSDCRAIDFLAMAGISPWEWPNEQISVWVVARTFPIRVAGNSGPLKGETSWGDLGLDEERTTVTNKVRRVGGPDWDLVRNAVEANGPSRVKLAVFMADQMFSELSGERHPSDLQGHHLRFLGDVQEAAGAPVWMVGTGPDSVIWPKGCPDELG